MARWLEEDQDKPPAPDWSKLDEETLVFDDLPEEPENDEDMLIIDVNGEILELTDHQRAMLKPPEERMRELVFPSSLAHRRAQKRKGHRTSRWARKFSERWTAKLQRKWKRRAANPEALAELKLQSEGKVSAPKATPKAKSRGKAKAASTTKDKRTLETTRTSE